MYEKIEDGKGRKGDIIDKSSIKRLIRIMYFKYILNVLNMYCIKYTM